jgi:4-hydroxybenzoate polyprenyltransferase
MTGAALLARRFSSLVRLEHSLFALPYAYVGALLAVDGWPGWENLVWITVAMVGARSLAMALNRLIDAEIDAANPRTARRELPSGLLSRAQVWALSAVALALLLLAVSQLAPITRWLWPIPVAMFVVYPYLKRVTPLCHLWLGASIGLAPVGAWVAITDEVPWQPFLIGAVVACWVAGFDVIYATMDLDHDRRSGLHSIPADLGLPRALMATRVLHGLAVVAMIAIGLELGLGVAYWIGVAVCALLLAYENSLVKPDDLSRVNAAFFNVNAILAAIYLAAVALDVAIRS